MHKKFIIVFIDGVSYDLIKDLAKKDFCPFIAKLIRRKGYSVHRFDPGIPTTTPYVQAGLFYGENSEIPGFRFVDKKKKRLYSLNEQADANAVEETFKNEGILKNGSSYANIFSGGAVKNILTASKLKVLPALPKNMDLLTHQIHSASLLFNPFLLARLVYLTLKEFALELIEGAFDTIKALIKREPFNLPLPILHPYPPFYRIMANVLFREFVTLGAKRDLKNNVPFICVSYLGYDWVAHFRGPRKASALNIVCEIDNEARKLYRIAKKKGYDFYIVSDHGIVPSIPMQKIHYETLEEVIRKSTGADVQSLKEREGYSLLLKYFVYHIKAARAGLFFPLKFLIKLLAKKLARPVLDGMEKRFFWNDKHLVIIEESSSLANIYFNFSDEQLDISEIKKKHPYLIERLVSHPAIGMIIGRDKNEVVVLAKTGCVKIKKGKAAFEGEDFLKVYGDRRLLVGQIERFAKMKFAGDLIAVGAFDGKRIISFARFHLGSHDSFGGEQNRAFIISKEKIPKITDSEQLYRIFTKYHSSSSSS